MATPQFRNIKMKGFKCKISSTGKSCTITITDWGVFERLKDVLLKKPIDPTGEYEFKEDDRMFGVGGKGMYEMYGEDEYCPPDYDETKREESKKEPGDEQEAPF